MNNIIFQQQQISQIDHLKQQFKSLVDKRETTYIEIGKTLNLLQDEMKEEGKLMEWLKSETRLSYSTANRYMKVAKGYKDVESWAIALGVKKAYLLLKISNQDERLDFMKEHQVRSKNYDEIKSLLIDYLNKGEKVDAPRIINPNSAINKLKKTIEKEVGNYDFIIDEMGSETPAQIIDIKKKLDELQILLMNINDTDSTTNIEGEEIKSSSILDDDEEDEETESSSILDDDEETKSYSWLDKY